MCGKVRQASAGLRNARNNLMKSVLKTAVPLQFDVKFAHPRHCSQWRQRKSSALNHDILPNISRTFSTGSQQNLQNLVGPWTTPASTRPVPPSLEYAPLDVGAHMGPHGFPFLHGPFGSRYGFPHVVMQPSSKLT